MLLVCRRDQGEAGISWQFPAGVVKPGMSPDTVAIRETLDETGVHCIVARRLGRRLHPVTRVLCDYLLCDYVLGEATNKDPIENVDVLWATKADLTRLIPPNQIYTEVFAAI
ncbi:NUDIX hydrolase [Amycolatopsis sp. GM8]|uniref:NUDIX hydrolase n=1 Tax=Amycolatopsis sp. GM8 TaxID=2896530 RepID=UPI0035ABBB40